MLTKVDLDRLDALFAKRENYHAPMIEIANDLDCLRAELAAIEEIVGGDVLLSKSLVALVAERVAERDDALAEAAGIREALDAISDLAERRGWNGVENSKSLHEFLWHYIEDREAEICGLREALLELNHKSCLDKS